VENQNAFSTFISNNIIALVALVVSIFSLFISLRRDAREKVKHGIELEHEKERQAEKQQRLEQKKIQFKLEEEKCLLALRACEVEGSKLSGSMDLAMQEIADNYLKDLAAAVGSLNERGLYRSGMKIQAEDNLAARRKTEEAACWEKKQQAERDWLARKKTLDLELNRIRDEMKLYGMT
jgi:hypothetical protein